MYKSTLLSLFLSCFLLTFLNAQNMEPQGAGDPNHPYIHDHICSHQKENPHYLKSNSSTEYPCPNNFQDWSALNNANLLKALKENYNYECFRPLFSYDATFGESLYNKEKIDLVITELNLLATNYTGQDSSGIYGVLLYLHTALYHEFYQAEVNLDASSQASLKQALQTYANNDAIWTVSKDAMNNLYEFYILCDFEGFRHDPVLYNAMKIGVQRMAIDKAWKPIANTNLLYYFDKAYNQMYFNIFRGIANNDQEFISAINNDPNNELITRIKIFVSDPEITEGDIFPRGQLNAFNELVRICTISELEDNVEAAFAEIANSHDRLSYFWYKSIEILVSKDKCAMYNLCEDLELLKEELMTMLFPNTWIFDDGDMVMQTSIDYNSAQELYYASKQVEAQFFRMMDTDEPLAGDPTSQLNMIVYGSLKEYKEWQYELFGLNTNNGGIYIERDATFYTYQRTPSESIYTLEELFRHEYVHYLEGRYLDPGFWGETQFYNNEEITWLNEGIAEYLAGSTDLDGVKLRNTIATQLENDASAMPVSSLVTAKYNSGFTFYRYANAFVMYMMTQEKSRFKSLLSSLKNDDLAAYNSQIDAMVNDNQLQDDFEEFLVEILSEPTAWWSVETYWEDWENLDLSTPAEIINAINGMFLLQNLEVSVDAESAIRRFKASAILPVGDKDAMTDMILNVLHNSSYDNFGFITGYYRYNSTDNELIITGSLASESVNTTEHSPIQSIQISPNPTTHQLNITSSLENYKYELTDLTGRTLMTDYGKQENFILNLSDLAQGVYLLRIYQNQETRTTKIIKQ